MRVRGSEVSLKEAGSGVIVIGAIRDRLQARNILFRNLLSEQRPNHFLFSPRLPLSEVEVTLNK